MTASQQRKSLTERGQAILLQAYEDLVTPEFILQRHFPDQTIEAAKSEIRRLCSASLLYSLPLAQRQRYYRLTRHGARAIQVHARHTRPLKRQGLVNRFAVSWFFNVHELNECYRFDPIDWADEFPAFANRRYWRRPFYIRETPTEDQTRFGVVIVDHGASRRRLTSKITDLLAELIKTGWLASKESPRRLTLTMLSFNADRAESLTHILERHLKTQLRSRVAQGMIVIESHCVPGLGALAINKLQHSTEK